MFFSTARLWIRPRWSKEQIERKRIKKTWRLLRYAPTPCFNFGRQRPSNRIRIRQFCSEDRICSCLLYRLGLFISASIGEHRKLILLLFDMVHRRQTRTSVLSTTVDANKNAGILSARTSVLVIMDLHFMKMDMIVRKEAVSTRSEHLLVKSWAQTIRIRILLVKNVSGTLQQLQDIALNW